MNRFNFKMMGLCVKQNIKTYTKHNNLKKLEKGLLIFVSFIAVPEYN